MTDTLRHVRRAGDRRRARGRHRGRARRPGRGARARRARGSDLTDSVNVMAANLTDQVRQIAQVDDRGRRRRPDAEGDRRGQGRGRGAGRDDQLDDRHAAHVRRAGDRRRARGGHARRARRSGRRAGRGGHVEGPHRLRELDGDEPDQPGAQHRRGHDRGRQRRPVADRSRSTRRARSSSSSGRSTRWSTSSSSFADEVTRVAREVGTEGVLGGQAEVEGVSGHVARPDRDRQLPGRRTSPTRCATSPRSRPRSPRGDLSQKITVDAQGEILELKNTINTMVDQLSSFADEVTRVAREVGTEGKLGGQAEVEGVCGTWRDLTDNVNLMAIEPHRPGPQHRAGHDGGRQRRPDAEDLRRRARRDPRAQGDHQHDGRPAAGVRLRGHARRARGGHGGQARRPGRGRGRERHVARPDREREPRWRRT